MYGHWFVVASEKKINIFTEVQERNQLKLIRTFENRYPDETTILPFAKDLVNFLDVQHQLKNYDHLTIAAEPHFMGKIRGKMKPRLESLVKNWIQKDLLKMPLKELQNHLPLYHPESIGPQ